MKNNLSKYLLIFFVLTIICNFSFAQQNLARFKQSYYHRVRRSDDTKLVVNQYKFHLKITGDFSVFDENTEIGVKIGELDVFENLGDESETVSFSTLGEAMDLIEDGFVRGSLDTEKGKGRIRAFLKKEIINNNKTKKYFVEKTNLVWNKKGMRITINFRDPYEKENEDPLIETLPVKLTDSDEWQEWDGRTFKINMSKITVVFGDRIYSSNDLTLDASAKFANEELKQARAKISKVVVASRNSSQLSMAVTPELSEGSSGRTTPPVGTWTVETGMDQSIKATPSSGYGFISWDVTGNAIINDASNSETTATINGDATITANFGEAATLTTTFTPENTGAVTPSAITEVIIGTPLEITATPVENYHFVKWTTDSTFAIFADSLAANTTVTLTGNATITANFTHDTATVTMLVSPSESGSTSPAEGQSNLSTLTDHSITATPSDNYHFTSWSASEKATLGDSLASTTTVYLTGDASITANFTHDTTILTMAVNIDGWGSTSPTVGDHTIETATLQKITALPATGYRFVRWTADSGAKLEDEYSSTTTATLTEKATVTAVYETDSGSAELTIMVSPSAGGSTNPGIGTHNVNIGESQTITATAADGYHFTTWTGSGSATIDSPKSINTTVKLSGTATVTAQFEGNTGTADLTIAISPAGGGSTNPGAGNYVVQKGEPQVLTALAVSGQSFVNWTVTGSATIEDPNSYSTIITLSDDATITANFEVQ